MWHCGGAGHLSTKVTYCLDLGRGGTGKAGERKGGWEGSLETRCAPAAGFYAEWSAARGSVVCEVTKQHRLVSCQLRGSASASDCNSCEWNPADQLRRGPRLFLFWRNLKRLYKCRPAPPASAPPGLLLTPKCQSFQVTLSAHDVHNYKRSQQTGHPATHRWDFQPHFHTPTRHSSCFKEFILTVKFAFFSLIFRAHSAAWQQNKRLQAQTNVLEYSWVSVQLPERPQCAFPCLSFWKSLGSFVFFKCVG